MNCLLEKLINAIELFIFFKILFIYLFIYRGGRGREREGEKNQCVVSSHVPPSGNLASDPSMCPNWELNWRLFSSQAGTQPTDSHQLGHAIFFLKTHDNSLLHMTYSYLVL